MNDSITSGLIGKYCIVRGESFGVLAGTVTAIDGPNVTLANARRLWFWDGAASVSQLAMEGVKNPGACKFSMAVNSILLRNYIEVIPCSTEAQAIIEKVKVWKR